MPGSTMAEPAAVAEPAAALAPGLARLMPEGCVVLVIGRHSQGAAVIEDTRGRVFIVCPEHLRPVDRTELC